MLNPSGTKNLIIFTIVSSLWGVVFGLIGPFYVVHVERLSGGMEKLGIAFSIMIICQSAASYLAGRFSDRLGRRPFLLLTAYVDAVVLFLYTVIHETMYLYMLQGLLGITNGVSETISVSLLADLTSKGGRGKEIGRFRALVSLTSAMGLALSGYLAKSYGINFLFYMASSVVVLSTALLFLIKEKEI
ncbi:MAG: MFS transporter [Deltaproteobacteria bacterium]|nr:MFS transporter [Deltaproteobacteria bacterium]